MPSEEPSPLEQAVEAEAVSRYHDALGDAQPRAIGNWWWPGSRRSGRYDEIAPHFDDADAGRGAHGRLARAASSDWIR